MTGFGRGCCEHNGVEVITEIRALNHRYLDISLRMPKTYSSFEPHLRKLISEQINRGKVDVSVSRYGTSGSVMEVMLDHNLAKQYHAGLVNLQNELGLDGVISISDMLTLKEIIVPHENETEIEKELVVLERSIREALSNLNQMRITEGETIWSDIEARLRAVSDLAQKVAPIVDQVPATAKARLQRRVQELTGGMELNEDRLLQEVALIAERSDVTEELTRLQSHVQQFIATGKEGSPLGRKLDFLLQELHREVNTLGSKSASTDIATYVVSMKAEVEKIREQTQNIE
jgi:uncharacterized protein (TIGR00255 family)